MTFTANNTAQAASFVSQNGSVGSVVCTGLDADAKHFYNAAGEYVGSRFTDSSAVTTSGNNGLLVEFLGTFAGE